MAQITYQSIFSNRVICNSIYNTKQLTVTFITNQKAIQIYTVNTCIGLFLLFIDCSAAENVYAHYVVSTSNSIFQGNNCILPFSSDTSVEQAGLTLSPMETDDGNYSYKVFETAFYSGHFEIIVTVSFYTLTLS